MLKHYHVSGGVFVYDLLTNQNIYRDGTKMMGDKIN